MFARFMPKEVKFFDLFNAQAHEIKLGAEALVAMLSALNHSEAQADIFAKEIDTIEDRADKINYQTVALLHSTFITPLDRDEIHQLTTQLDNVLDMIQNAARTMRVYNVRTATPEAIEFGRIIQLAAAKVAEGVALLSNMDNATAILAVCRDIDRLENEADEVLRTAMSKLFREEDNVKELIKLKGIYERLESVTDYCDNVGNLLQAIVLENS
ncbi:DUF47 domain-containing protein [Agitococcus lubricus]|uniref:Phosphate transport regulator n=1 Tax=Agitococcus lubricus TaxID=1077255 RepID=A0A2T5IWT8_9GAMM|nr:DUF47 family protein [Agitococcus lubricus]PTQ88411.1 hypothetical protein C8N29_11256 [Agitococcus lubricus]